jgi:hypothetical protein
MARVFPPEIPDPLRSKAEAHIFERFKRDAPDDWVVIHSVGLTTHRSKPWAEIDFVVIGSFGVMCLEVKGGAVSLHDGRWTTNGTPLKESPFQQAAGGSSALHNYLRERLDHGARAMVFPAVAFPDCVFAAELPGVLDQAVYDAHSRDTPITEFVREAASGARRALSAKLGHRPEDIPAGVQSRIRHLIAPDFSLVRSIRAELADVEAELVRLTDSQVDALEGMAQESRVVIRGGAGTGKTLLAVNEARRLAATGQRVLFTCYSSVLAEHLAGALDDTTVTVRQSHALMRELIEEGGLSSSLPSVEPADLEAIFLPKLAIDALERLGRVQEFDALIVDEAQDVLLPTHAEFFSWCLAGELTEGCWRVFLDPNQDLFSGAEPETLDHLDDLGVRYRLTTNCRNTRNIATITAALSGTDPARTRQGAGPKVVTQFYADDRDQQRLIAAALRDWVAHDAPLDEMVVLSRHRLELSCAGRIHKGLPYPLTAGRPGGGAPRIHFSTIADFKGLDASLVLLTDLSDLSASWARGDLYVGASRARSMLSLLIAEDQRELWSDRLADFAGRFGG